MDTEILKRLYIVEDQSKFYEYGFFAPECIPVEGILISSALTREQAIEDLREFTYHVLNYSLDGASRLKKYFSVDRNVYLLCKEYQIRGKNIPVLSDMEEFKKIVDRQKFDAGDGEKQNIKNLKDLIYRLRFVLGLTNTFDTDIIGIIDRNITEICEVTEKELNKLLEEQKRQMLFTSGIFSKG